MASSTALPVADVSSLPFSKLANTFEVLETSQLKGWKRRQMLFTDKLLHAYRVRKFFLWSAQSPITNELHRAELTFCHM